MFNNVRAKQLKEEQGRETSWLADRCGVKSDTIRLYLNGNQNPSRSVVILMAQALEVPESEIWSREAPPQKRTA